MGPLAELATLEAADGFVARHVAPTQADIAAMLQTVGAATLDELAAKTVPGGIRSSQALDLPEPIDEAAVIAELRTLAAMNGARKPLIGQGYHGTHTPPVIQRNILENPGWYTAYTPYQAEIAQGRLEALLNFQTMVCELTAMPIANASLLDEATAAAEAMAMAHAVSRAKSDVVAVAADLHPQTRAVLATRARPLGWRLVEVAPGDTAAIAAARPCALLLQYPGTSGALRDLHPEITAAHEAGALAIVAADLLSLALLTPPGEMGADVVIGSAQRFGVPMGFGGPHAAFFATRDAYRRQMPGRLVGVSLDAAGEPAMRLALQTREQHIRREKATSNICTAQVLLAVMAAMYAVWHGPDGLRRIARRVNLQARFLADAARRAGLAIRHDAFFDSPAIETPDPDALLARAAEAGFDLRRLDATGVGIALDETVTRDELHRLATVLGAELGAAPPSIPAVLARGTPFLEQAVFNRHHAEHEMLRYL
ncbi:MAG: aminomethyl-transferring glycine dehydrogenase subunit GcvPA, partial [Acidisphaera sp.]|nr:aminomethyl-transferring glycine dehydrogenase subunit GcvPA [Acidisphaera sp.]